MLIHPLFVSVYNSWVPALNSIRLLCREWLCNAPRLVHGLLSRRQTESLLASKKEGTFLFRFSTSHLGLLSISFVGRASRKLAEGEEEAKRPPSPAPQTVLRHFLVQLEEDGRCALLCLATFDGS